MTKISAWLKEKMKGDNPGIYIFPTINIYEDGIYIIWLRWIIEVTKWYR